MKRFIVIDGNAVLHRAYHAMPPLTAPDGSIVGAVYGFISMLIRLYNDFRPTHMAVAFDRPAPTFRKKLFKEYQATRPVVEDALIRQIDVVHEGLKAFAIPVYEQDGFEADDIIGTLCRQIPNPKHQNPNNQTIQIIIVTGDRDLLQLVEDDRVLVYMPTKGLSEAKLYNAKETVERMGVPPGQIADLKALMGDASDNYPGVAGIGPKTAITLLSTYATVEDIYSAIDENILRGASQLTLDKLKAGRESAILSKELAVIRTDVPIVFDETACQVSSLNTPQANAILDRLHFHSLIKRIDNLGKEKSVKEKKSEKGKTRSAPEEQLTLV